MCDVSDDGGGDNDSITDGDTWGDAENPVYSAATGHWYRWVNNGTYITWAQAQAAGFDCRLDRRSAGKLEFAGELDDLERQFRQRGQHELLAGDLLFQPRHLFRQ